MRDQMQGIFVLGTIGDGIDRSLLGMGEFIQAAFEQDHQLALAGGRGTVQHQNAFADIRACRGGFQIFHDSGERLVDPKELVCEELIYFIAILIGLDTIRADHVIDTCMSQLRELRILEHEWEILTEST